MPLTEQDWATTTAFFSLLTNNDCQLWAFDVEGGEPQQVKTVGGTGTIACNVVSSYLRNTDAYAIATCDGARCDIEYVRKWACSSLEF